MAHTGHPAELHQDMAGPRGGWKPLSGFGVAVCVISFAALVVATAGFIPALRAAQTEAPAGPAAVDYSPAGGLAGSAFAQAAGMDWGAALASSPPPAARTSVLAAESAPAVAAGPELSAISVSPVTVASAWSMGPLPERPAFVRDLAPPATEASSVELMPLRMSSSVVAGPQPE